MFSSFTFVLPFSGLLLYLISCGFFWPLCPISEYISLRPHTFSYLISQLSASCELPVTHLKAAPKLHCRFPFWLSDYFPSCWICNYPGAWILGGLLHLHWYSWYSAQRIYSACFCIFWSCLGFAFCPSVQLHQCLKPATPHHRELTGLCLRMSVFFLTKESISFWTTSTVLCVASAYMGILWGGTPDP